MWVEEMRKMEENQLVVIEGIEEACSVLAVGYTFIYIGSCRLIAIRHISVS